MKIPMAHRILVVYFLLSINLSINTNANIPKINTLEEFHHCVAAEKVMSNIPHKEANLFFFVIIMQNSNEISINATNLPYQSKLNPPSNPKTRYPIINGLLIIIISATAGLTKANISVWVPLK